MRIVIDMQGAQTESRFRGIGRYTLAFAQAVVRNCGEHEVILALSGLFPDTIDTIRAAFHGLLQQRNICVWSAPGPVKAEHPDNDAHRETAELIREAFLASLRPDIIHITSLFEGYVDDAVTSIGRFDTQTPISVSLYDLIPLLNPDQYLTPNPRYAIYYERKIASLRQAQWMLAISEYSRKEGIDALNDSSGRIVNVGTAIGSEFRPLNTTPALASELFSRIGITRAMVLYTGGSDERKNLPRLIEAWSALPASLRQTHQLLFAGRMPEGNVAEFRRIARHHGLQPDELLFSGYIDDQELVQLYNLCRLYVFPSWHEGFGLPALEAMACGAPVVGANTSSLPEVIGLNDALFDPFDVVDMAKKMAEVLQDKEFEIKLRKHGEQQARKFSWDTTAQRAIAAWETLLPSRSAQPFPLFTAGKKPKLAFISPLPPERTGIADYSAELLPALAAHYDIELVVAQSRVDALWGNGCFNVRDVDWLRANFKNVDRVLYQIGNSPFHQHMLPLLEEIPGTVVLHDFYMSGLMAWLEQHAASNAWTNALYTAHGYSAIRERCRSAENAKIQYPVNWSTLQHAQGIIVHSDYSRSLAKKWYGSQVATEWEVIPHLRSRANYSEKKLARKQLGIDDDDFIVCSFGFLDATKLNHRLLQAWLSSALAADKRCRLIFVGENHGGSYGVNLRLTMQKSKLGDRIQITGFASTQLFKQYLAAADVAVQLRTDSRGETSGTVLDSMNHGLALIVNANGSMAELDAKAVWMLPDEFSDAALIDALQTLWHDPERRCSLGVQASAIIHDRHAPEKCAAQYAAAIEDFHQRSVTAMPALIHAIAAQKHAPPEGPELIRLSSALAATFPLPQPAKRLFLDVTATCRNDLKTGIERVARALMLAMLETPPEGYRIEPVYLSNAGDTWHYRYARRYTLELLDCKNVILEDECIDPQNGDIIIGLDISGEMLIEAEKSGLYDYYRRIGVSTYFMVHDLLPILMPENFPPGANESHEKWLRAISDFDGIICVSKTVADDFSIWKKQINTLENKSIKTHIGWSHHGADVVNSAPSSGLPKNAEFLLKNLSKNPSFLMVGTIEPRKGYLQTLKAFEQLWREGAEVNLVIVGYEGWKSLPNELRRDIPQTVEKLRNHPQLNKHLFWLEGISDEYLDKVYAASACLIAASYGEGFGLPLIEAAQHQLPIIARDIPVFREVAIEHAYYFDGLAPQDLANAIQRWLVLYASGQHPRSETMPWLTWAQSAQGLLQHLLPAMQPNGLET